MKKYKSILFDVDDTLLDFKAGETTALRRLFESQKIQLTTPIVETYEKKNKELWSVLEQGNISREEVLAGRFTYIFDAIGQPKDGKEMDAIFRKYLGEEGILLEGALPMIQHLAPMYDLYVVTNGVSTTQYQRLDKAGIQNYFKNIFVSEDTGYQKPMKGFFDFVMKHSPEIKETTGLIVGDSLSADIKGGNNIGMDTCWYNPSKQVNDSDIQPTYEIHDYQELLQILA